jgi:hypothetical protein
LVVYAGEEIATDAGLPSLHELAAGLLSQREVSDHQRDEIHGYLEDGDVPAALGLLTRALGHDRFCKLVEANIDDKRAGTLIPVPELARAIARLGPRLRGVVTPNLDGLLERAFGDRRPTMYTSADAELNLPAIKGWLLKVRGTVERRSTWVLTDAQLGQVQHGAGKLPQTLEALLITQPVLFVGTKLDDPILQLALDRIRGIQGGGPGGRHWALTLDKQAERKFRGAGVSVISCRDGNERLELLRPLTPLLDPESNPPSVTSASAGASTQSERQIILMLSSNPEDTDSIQVDEEYNSIDTALRLSAHRDRFELRYKPRMGARDVAGELLRHNPHIVHFSGHGDEKGRLIFTASDGYSQQADHTAIATVFEKAGTRIDCVVLSACYSAPQAALIAKSVKYVVGMTAKISVDAAIRFSAAFYEALGYDRSVEDAFSLGLAAITLDNLPGGEVPHLYVGGALHGG